MWYASLMVHGYPYGQVVMDIKPNERLVELLYARDSSGLGTGSGNSIWLAVRQGSAADANPQAAFKQAAFTYLSRHPELHSLFFGWEDLASGDMGEDLARVGVRLIELPIHQSLDIDHGDDFSFELEDQLKAAGVSRIDHKVSL